MFFVSLFSVSRTQVKKGAVPLLVQFLEKFPNLEELEWVFYKYMYLYLVACSASPHSFNFQNNRLLAKDSEDWCTPTFQNASAKATKVSIREHACKPQRMLLKWWSSWTCFIQLLGLMHLYFRVLLEICLTCFPPWNSAGKWCGGIVNSVCFWLC